MENNHQLGYLADPYQLHNPIDISTSFPEKLISQLRMMLTIRYAEEKIADMYTAGKIKCPCHLGIGQEAPAIAVSEHLRPTDRVFGAHRSHTHFLALGGSVYQLFAETLGKVTGCSKGMGGSMHLYDKSIGFLGSVPIVGASVPIATGAALAAKMDGKGDVAVSYLGDSALEEGAVQESLNLASIMQLPVIYVVENNLFASHLHIDLRQPTNSIARYAEAHHIPFACIDGNDIVTISKVAGEMVANARGGKGPAFIEAVTYRWRGHVGPSEDIDVGVQRQDDLALWKKRDPVLRLKQALVNNGHFSDNDFIAMQENVRNEINEFWIKAEEADFPETAALFDLVYKK
jgi:TPP-dependent pyruvate/acetoin dehydrogenase alpha subunit